MKNVWQNLKKPIFIQAPMEDVTDTVLRQMLLRTGKPDLFFTEFTSVEGLCSKGFENVSKRLKFSVAEKPIIAQIWGKTPENFYKAAQMLKEMKFDGIDINLGCPVKTIVKNGCCSALINNHPLTQEIIQATKEGASSLPVSVKTRLGFAKIQTEEWISFLLEQNIDAITLHGRIAKDMSKFPANWEEIGKAVELRNKIASATIIIGNGDVLNRIEAEEKVKKYGVDGIMIGRGIFSNIWVFDKTIDSSQVSKEERLKLLTYHIKLYQDTWNGQKNFDPLKKFYKVYINGFNGASGLREKLIKYKTLEETLNYLATL